jgi:PKD repeat protein
MWSNHYNEVDERFYIMRIFSSLRILRSFIYLELLYKAYEVEGVTMRGDSPIHNFNFLYNYKLIISILVIFLLIGTVSAANNATVVSDTIPSVMNASQSYPVNITMKNDGTTIWNETYSYRLGNWNIDAYEFNMSGRLYITGSVNPGSNYIFNFTMTAPPVNGTYTPQFRMLRESVEWFGETLNHTIVVSRHDPVASLTSNVTAGIAPFTVQFNDTSTNTIGRSWFFGDETYNQSWIQQNASGGWVGRFGHASAALPDGSVVVIGGTINGTAGGINGTIWRSTNNGLTWSLVSSYPQFGSRVFYSPTAAVTLPDGSIIVTGGGNATTAFNDTWRSVDNGIIWTQLNTSGGWLPRASHQMVVMPDGSILLMGGQSYGVYKNDTWRSTDKGITWTQMNSSSGWSGRQAFGAVSLSDGSVVVMGGTFNGTTGGSLNDTWRSTNNGATWTQMNASSGWDARQYFTVNSLPDDSIVLIGGYNLSGSNKQDTWRSTDKGAKWTQINATNGWTSRRAHASVAMPNGTLILMGGLTAVGVNDTWVFNPAGSNSENLTRTYVSTGNYNVSLQVYNTSGYSTLRQSNYIKSSIPSYTSTYGIYTVVKFNNSGSTEWTVPVDVTKVDYLVVAGGGAGGDVMGGGGGAGGFLDGFNYSVTTGANYTINVGDGGKYLDTAGSPPALRGVKGANSSFATIESAGGGGGSAHAFGNATNGGSGGGGGSCNSGGYCTGGTGIVGQGYAGGNSGAFWYYNGAGGGGASQTGSDGTSLVGGNGGDGKNSSITGVNVTYAGGGGGGGSKYGNNVNGTGGTGGGGNGGGGPGQSTNATDGLGGGGGGVYHDYDYPGNSTIDGTFGRGGSGIVILRYITPVAPVADFTSNVTIGSPSLPVQFNDTSMNSPSGWSWFFGDESYNQSWNQQNASSGWGGRSYASSVALPDNSIVIMGGYIGSTYLNDAWRSTDSGTTWVLQNASSGWTQRQLLTSSTMHDGSIILMGGQDITGLINDTWRSTDKGVTWIRMNASSGWTKRYGLSSVIASDGSIILMGGHDGSNYRNDTWRSTDNGATWVLQNASSGWGARYIHSVVTSTDGSIILTGGFGDASVPLNDVWRSTDNGATWMRMSASAAFSARYGSAFVPMPDNSIVLMGGFSSGGKNDVWRSSNGGITWNQINASAGWSGRWGTSGVAMSDGNIIILSGYDGSYRNDTWRFNPVGSSVQNATHLYTSVGRYNVSLQSYNSAGYNNTRKIQYIDVGLSPTAVLGASEPSGFEGYVSIPIIFTNYSINSPTSWNWSFRDVTGNNTEVWFSQSQSFVYSFTTAGNYTIRLNASNNYGYNITPGYYWLNLSMPITPPVAQFSGSPVIGPPPLSVLFTDLSASSTGWAWFFDDETYNQSWSYTNLSSGWDARLYHSTVSLHDGMIILTGGTTTGFSAGAKNDTWKSTNYGTTWTLINASSGWDPRYDHLTVLMPDGSIVLMGGVNDSGYYKNDTWRTTDEGLTWTRVNASSGWLSRVGMTGIAVQNPSNSIIIMGGANGTKRMNDTWQSTDYGATWILMNSNPGWLARFDAGSVVMQDSSIVLMGGANTAGDIYTDVWRSTDKGATWTIQTASSGFGERARFPTARLPDDSIIILGGDLEGPSVANDVWRSTDYGITWTQVNASAGWSARYGHTSVLMPNCSILIMGGNDLVDLKNDTWLFNPTGSTLQNPSHTFLNSGYYDVSLRSYNFYGYNTTAKYLYINVIGATAAFNATPNPAQLGTPITFVDMSSNGPTQWNWSFGDGNYSSSRNATYTYPTIGEFTVLLNASNIYGFSNVSHNVTIYPSAPVANFTIDHNIGSVPLTVQFTDTSGVGITGWYWNFDDGGTSILQNPSHVYLALGTYHAQLTVTSSVGTNVSQSQAIYVVNSAVPIADFSGAPTVGSAPLSVQFTDLSVALSGVNAWNWSFGDGNYSNAQNPVHIYSSGGQYTVMLTATSGAFSNYTTKAGYINIGVPSSSVSANFTANITYAATYPATVQFYDTSVCNPVCTNWAWDLNGDGATDSMLQNPVYTYTYPGNYSPKLVVSNGINAGTKIRNQYIIIGPVLVHPTIPQPTNAWVPGYQYNGSIWEFKGTSYVDLPNSTFLKYWLQNFSATGNFSVYGFATGLMAPLMHVFGFWIFLIVWGLYLFAVWIRSQDVTLPLIIGILSMGTFGLLFPKESLPVIIIMFVICGAIIITKLMKDSI